MAHKSTKRPFKIIDKVRNKFKNTRCIKSLHPISQIYIYFKNEGIKVERSKIYS